jgi:hypothetical protein
MMLPVRVRARLFGCALAHSLCEKTSSEQPGTQTNKTSPACAHRFPRPQIDFRVPRATRRHCEREGPAAVSAHDGQGAVRPN